MSNNFAGFGGGIFVGSLSADPSGGRPGEFYYNTSTLVYRFFNGTSWAPIATGGGSGVSNYWSGFYDHGNYWQTTTTGGFTNFLPQTSINLNQRVGSGITVTATTGISTGVDVAGISWTPPSVTSVYLITMTGSINCNANNYVLLKMTDGTQTMTQLEWLSASTGTFESFTLSAIYIPGVTSTVEVVIYGYPLSGNFTLGVPSGDASASTPLDITLVQLIA